MSCVENPVIVVVDGMLVSSFVMMCVDDGGDDVVFAYSRLSNGV